MNNRHENLVVKLESELIGRDTIPIGEGERILGKREFRKLVKREAKKFEKARIITFNRNKYFCIRSLAEIRIGATSSVTPPTYKELKEKHIFYNYSLIFNLTYGAIGIIITYFLFLPLFQGLFVLFLFIALYLCLGYLIYKELFLQK